MSELARRIDLKAVDRNGAQIPSASFKYWVNGDGPVDALAPAGQSSIEITDRSAKVHVQAYVGKMESTKVLLSQDQNTWQFDFKEVEVNPKPNSARRWVTAAAIVVIAFVAYVLMQSGPSGVGSRWMLLREPAGQSLAIGTMWDGNSIVTECYSAEFKVDTLGGSDAELSITSAGGTVGLQLLGAIGLENVGKKVGTWSLHAWGPRIYSAVNPSPVLREKCAPQRDGLPRFPMITGLLGYDSIALRTTGASSLSGKVTAQDTSVLRNANATIALNDSALTIRHGQGLIFGFRAMGLRPGSDSTCTKEVALGEELTCGPFPYVATAEERFPGGQYRIVSINRNAPNAVARSDTVQQSAYVTLGVALTSAGTFGDWYSLRLTPSTNPNHLVLTMRRFRYNIERFESESDRVRWAAFIR